MLQVSTMHVVEDCWFSAFSDVEYVFWVEIELDCFWHEFLSIISRK